MVKKIAAIEDNDLKWERIEPVIRKVDPAVDITRARDQFTGEKLILEGQWDLVMLDISLDIRAGASKSGRGAHDYTAGLKIAGMMYLLRKEAPTIIVTGFDAFPSGRSSHEQDVILGLEDVEREARRYLGDHLIGTLRYGSPDWQSNLVSLLEGRL